nr:immunoglobulin heavy chain junction region [Mus musculus]
YYCARIYYYGSHWYFD